jgi:hypothetical protein
MQKDRRDPHRQRPKPGGNRAIDPPPSEPPYSTRECADWMGMSDEYIREAINQGVWTANGLVRLEAEYVPTNATRGVYRIHQDAFIAFLTKINWKRIPARR